jgi:hypothetical protein
MMRENADLGNVLSFGRSIKKSNSKSDLTKENLEQVDRATNNRSINQYSSKNDNIIFETKRVSQMPNYKNRLKQSKLVESYVSESRIATGRKRYSGFNGGINGIISIKDTMNNSFDKSDEYNDDYRRKSSVQDTISLSKRKRPINLTKVINEECIPEINSKYNTPVNNISKIPSLERQSDMTTYFSEMKTMRKISKSICKIRMQKQVKKHPISMPINTKLFNNNLSISERFSRDESSTAYSPTIPVKNNVTKIITENEGAFGYTNQEKELLFKYPIIIQKLGDWNQDLSSDYLKELKKKQRQIGNLTSFI